MNAGVRKKHVFHKQNAEGEEFDDNTNNVFSSKAKVFGVKCPEESNHKPMQNARWEAIFGQLSQV